MGKEIIISKELLERILVYLGICHDEGDYRETWQSDQLKRDTKEVIELLSQRAE